MLWGAGVGERVGVAKGGVVEGWFERFTIVGKVDRGQGDTHRHVGCQWRCDLRADLLCTQIPLCDRILRVVAECVEDSAPAFGAEIVVT